jgi:hypothetical protein
MKVSNISHGNLRRIMAFVKGEPGGLQESKLQAFYRLIQARGETITNRAGFALYNGAECPGFDYFRHGCPGHLKRVETIKEGRGIT